MIRHLYAVAAATILFAACSESGTDPTVPTAPTVPGIRGYNEASSGSGWIRAELDDYPPGTVVTILGGGWEPGETVIMVMSDEPNVQEDLVLTSVADESGGFVNTDFSTTEIHVGVTFTVAAEGQTSGMNASTMFDDSQPQSIVLGPASVTVEPGSPALYDAAVRMVGNANNCTVTLEVTTALPTGASASFNNNPITGNSDFSRTLTINTTLATPSGTYPFTVQASRGANCQGSSAETTNGTLIVQGPIDTTPPSIGYVLDPASPDGDNGWYKTDVTITWTVTENESPGSLSSVGCVDQTISADQAESAYTCSASSSGGSAGPMSVSIKRDGTAPNLAFAGASPAPPNGSNGWYTSDVTATFTASDVTSGLADLSQASLMVQSSAEGSAVAIASGSVADNAGNVASSVDAGPFKIDKTAPTVSATAVPPANANGWNNTDVTVSFVGTDGVSGIDSCDADVTLSSEGANQSASGTCTDAAGNVSASATASDINIDKTDPSLSGAATTLPNANGWYRNDVVIAWTCSDALSGIDGNCPSDSSITGEGSNLSANAVVSDKAGNGASANVTGIMIDRTAPDVAVTGVSNGAIYTLGTVPAAGCSTTDALSGVAMTASLSQSGGPVGPVTATCSGGKDYADNVAGAKSVTYTVLYAFVGFSRPVDNPEVFNVAKAGQAVPLKWRLTDGLGNPVLNLATVKVTVSGVTCDLGDSQDLLEEYASGSSGLQNLGDGYYQFNWKTPGSYAKSCKTMKLDLGEGPGQEHRALFQFTR